MGDRPRRPGLSSRSARRWAAGIAATVLAGVALAVALSAGGGPRRHTAPSTTATGPAPLPASVQLGASVNRLFNTTAYSPEQIDSQLSALAQTGATLARSDALWEAAEPEPPGGTVHHYDWSFADRIATSLAQHGLRWLAIIDYSAPWAQSIRGQDHSAPTSAASYAFYAAAFARRYGEGGTFWSAHQELRPQPVDTYEIWNEPDNPAFWSPAPNPAAYDELYARARAAIAAVQPSARVIVGGLTHPARFLPEMLSADPSLRGSIDGVGIHPYGRTPQRVLGSVRDARRALDALGLETVPLYVTELGWTTSPPGTLDYLPERLRPGYIHAAMTGLARIGCGVAAAILYTWMTPERDPADPQDWFGIHPPGGGSSPDSAAFAAANRDARAAGPAPAGCAA